MSYSRYMALATANWLAQVAAFPALPSNTWLSLHSALPDPITGNNELIGGGYLRANVDWVIAPNPTEVTMANNAPIIFPVATATLGNVTHFGVWDLNANGNFLAFGEFDVIAQWVNGTSFVVPLNQLQLDVVTQLVTVP